MKNNNSIVFTPIIPDDRLMQFCQTFFPLVNGDFNGVFGQQAIWYCLQLQQADENQLIATCTIGQINLNNIFLYNVAVHPDYRRCGFGFRLMNEIVNRYGQQNIYLFVELDNRPAISLYRKFHFEYVSNVYKPPPGQMCLLRTKNETDLHG